MNGPGVSRELAASRAKSLTDVRYALSLDITARDTVPGQVVVSFRRTGTADVVLDFRGRSLGTVVVNGTRVPKVAYNGAHLTLPAALLRNGANQVQISFVATSAPTGASIIRSTDRSDGSDYLYTLLVPADANQLFPSFDQPDLKARVTLTLRTPGAWTAIANGRLTRSDTAGAVVTHQYAETAPISTYLIAFAAGPWHHASSTVRGRTINAYVRASRAREADLDTLLALNHRALEWMERYFDRPYPFDKYDFVLAPAFPFGGMEHPGAVFYNEDRFIFRERPTLPRVLGRYNTILHEVAHQWFGDLVTMKWFDDLWLKEGFATYIAAKALSDLEPTSEAWKTFYLGNKPAAYGVDQTLGTTPLWQQLGNLDQAKSNYGAIVYNKAPSVLKQLNFLVGDAAFQRGVRQFLATHAFANATWQDLLAAIGGAAGRDLTAWGRQWMLRPGMPDVETRLTLKDGRIASLQLRQRPVQPTVSGQGSWPLKVRVAVVQCDSACRVRPEQELFAAGQIRTVDVELRGRETDVPLVRGLRDVRFIYSNAGDYGYQRVALDSASRRVLLAGALPSAQDPLLRAMFWGTLWDDVRAARLHPARFVALVVRDLPQEGDEQIVPSQLGRLSRAMNAYLVDMARDSLQLPVERFLWSGAGNSALPYGIRRAYLDAFIGMARSPSALARLRDVLAADSAAGDVVRDPLRWEIVNRLIVIGADDADARLTAQAVRDSTPDGRRRVFIAGGARGNAVVKTEYFRRYFADATLNEDWASASLGTFNALEHQAITRGFLRPALDSLPYIQANRRIFFLGAWLGAFLGGQTDASALDMVQAFLREHPRLPRDLREKVLQSADELARTVRIRAEFGRTFEQ
ncbi:MAG: ERAP1-like C-terminal domain-containing protein [Gemmatimonadetes bacterium]|nr:ERAP1-like C-terminal domain-containing protein [Gemmatimonadota bacterium]